MKRALSLLITVSCCLAAWGQNGDDGCSPKGSNETLTVNDSIKEKVGEVHSMWRLSYDPNEIIGPEGYDSLRWVSANDVLNYTIMFENDSNFATAAAQRVDVRFDFQNKAWMKGFGIGNYSFSNMSFPVAEPSNAYQQRIDLKDSLGYYVDLIGGLDVARQQGFWTFTTIDPETGYAPWRSEIGMLPVNDSTHVGEGAVTFQLKPYEGLHTGDTISIQAFIVFDQNDTIPTNRWCNKIDAGMPESNMTAKPHSSLPNVYNLTFTGKDDKGGSGLRHILLYQENHSGIYEEIDTVAADSVLAFPVETGKQYKLYSLAVDNTGNREPAKEQPDVTLNFNRAPSDIALSDSVFHDDLGAGGFVGRLTSIDSEDNKGFAYALAEGDGAIHNDLFQINDDQLQIRNSFKCAEDSIYKVRISTTDDGGLTFSKAFELRMRSVLVKPEPDTLEVQICTGETCLFHGYEYGETGIFRYCQSNDYMCDSVFVLKLNVLQPLAPPIVTVEGTHTLVSSAAKGNQWFYGDGTPVEGATEQQFTPEDDGIYYVAASNGACFSDPSQAFRIQLTDSIGLELELEKGWNWISHNLYNDVAVDQLDEALRILSQGEETYNDETYGFVGDLKALRPVEGYKLQMAEDGDLQLSGRLNKVEPRPVRLSKGWNWIGYVPVEEEALSVALSKLTPEENDVVKTLDEFAMYSGGKWNGPLVSMKPGVGYMYYSQTGKQFTYPLTCAYPVTDYSKMRQSLDTSATPWRYDKHAFCDNQTMVAELYADNAKAMEGIYVVGAFVDDECRGVGTYIDGLLYITIHGMISGQETVSFKAYELTTDQELPVRETLRFDGRQTGSVTKPYQLHVSTTTEIDNITSSLNIYPNPVRSTMFINGDTNQILDLKILSVNGGVVFTADNYPDGGVDVDALTPGVYVVAIHTKNGYQYKKIMKVN